LEVEVPSIRIIAVPKGFAPLEIREAWVGCVIPLVTDAELEADFTSNLPLGSDNIEGYLVLSSEAIKALEEIGETEAASYWEEVMFGIGSCLQFAKNVCEIVD
jgi:hypothetical protein